MDQPSLDSIISSGREPTSAPPALASEPAQTPQPEQAAQQPHAMGDDDAFEGQTVDANGQKLVPLAAVQAERQKAKRYTEQVAEFQKTIAERDAAIERRFSEVLQRLPQPQQAPAPDFFENPAAFVQQHTAPLEQQMQAQREQFSRMMAEDKFGAEAVQTAYAELEKRAKSDPQGSYADYVRVMQSPHPYAALVQWHKQQQVMAEIGTDPVAYREKVKAELLAELQQNGGQPPAAQQPAQVMPSNFAAARNVGARSGPAWSGPPQLSDIFNRKRAPA